MLLWCGGVAARLARGLTVAVVAQVAVERKRHRVGEQVVTVTVEPLVKKRPDEFDDDEEE